MILILYFIVFEFVLLFIVVGLLVFIDGGTIGGI